MRANIEDALQYIDSKDKNIWDAVSIALRSAGYDFEIYERWCRKDGYKHYDKEGRETDIRK